MDGITIEELRARRTILTTERETFQQEARERDIGYAFALGEIEQLIKLIEARTKATP